MELILGLSKYFPPTEKDVKSEEQQSSATESSKPLAEQLPDPPTTDPSQENEMPNAKKQKLDHASSGTEEELSDETE